MTPTQQIAALTDALKQGIDLIKGEKTGSEWKRGCADFIRTGRAALAAVQAPAEVEPVAAHSDDAAVDRFALAMKAKLAGSREKGRGGWDDPSQCSVEFLAQLLLGHVTKGNAGNFEDIANLAMMLHQRGADPAVLASTKVEPLYTHPPAAPTVQDAARVLLDAVKSGAVDPFDATDLAIEALAVRYAGNRGDGVMQLEIGETFFRAALRAIAGEGTSTNSTNTGWRHIKDGIWRKY